MPHMVMSQLPKNQGLLTRRRLKGGKDNIVQINYMYVGIPKTKFTFYVRERLVYRSSVEVTFDDVFNYLSQVCNDSSISLHYTVNNQYVSITTTGQLHTFLQHIHNDPNMFLYLENKDYVWNVKPKNKSHKKKKQDGEVEDTLRKRKCECEHHRDEEDDDDMTSDDDVSSYLSDEESSEDCSDIDDDDQKTVTVSETSEEEESSPNINKLEKPVKTVESDTSACSGASSGSAGLGAEEDDNDEQITFDRIAAVSSNSHLKTDIDSLKVFIKKVIEEHAYPNFSKKSLQPYCELIARKLISNFWPPKATMDTIIYEKTVSVLTFVVGTSLCIYYNGLKKGKCDPNLLFDKFTLTIIEEALVIIEKHIRLFHLLLKIEVLQSFDGAEVEKCEFDDNLPSVEFVREELKQIADVLKVAFDKIFTKDSCRCIEPIEVFGKQIDQFLNMLTEFDNMDEDDVENYRGLILQINRAATKFSDTSCDSHAHLEELIEGGGVKAEILKSFGIATSDTSSEEDESVDERVTSKPVPRKDLSPEVQEHIDNMLKIPQHTYVYPPIPSPGKIMVPTGGLARCRCSKTCTFYLNEPEYACLERFNEPRQSLLEKTKQKRFKKN